MKTVFEDGDPVLPSVMNKILNPSFKETPEEDGELPLPPLALSPEQGLPVNYCMNSSMCGIDRLNGQGNITWSGPNISEQTVCCGLLVFAHSASAAALQIGNAVGGPTFGFKSFNVGPQAPAAGDKLSYFLAETHNLSSGYYNRQHSEAQHNELTIQVEVKNNASENNSGSSSITASLLIAEESSLVSNGEIEVLQASEPLVLADGQSGYLWKRIKILKSLTDAYLNHAKPEISFEQNSTGNFQHEIRSLCIFSGNTFGKKLRSNNDKHLAEVITQAATPSNLYKIDANTIVYDSFLTFYANTTSTDLKFRKMPDSSIQTSGRIDLGSAFSGDSWGEISGNPLSIPSTQGQINTVFLGLEVVNGVSLIHHVVRYDEPNDKTIFGFSSSISGSWTLQPRLVAPFTMYNI